MIIARSLSEYNEAYGALSDKSDIGFVPTMGALHRGHISLIESSVKECRHTVVSIFVNPTQFNDLSDFEKYPRDEQKDIDLLNESGIDILFLPAVKDIYPVEDKRVFDLGGLDMFGEGPQRPGHFNGMVQVVTRLFDIVKPSKAFFGIKDYQQLAIVRYFTRQLQYPISIIPVEIFRENDGLAMSSRNLRLTPEQRAAAPDIYKALTKAVEMSQGGISPDQVCAEVKKMIDSNNLLKTEYVEIINALTLQPVNSWDEADGIRLWCAVLASPVRLIDNIKLK